MRSSFASWFTDNHQERELIIISWTVWVLCVFITAMRLGVRWWYNRIFKPSDWVILLAEILIVIVYGLQINELLAEVSDQSTSIYEQGRRLQVCTAMTIISWSALACSRLSILFLYTEIFIAPLQRILFYLGMALCIIHTIAIIPAVGYACVPWRGPRDRDDVIMSVGICNRSHYPISLTNSIVSITLDLYVFFVPIRAITRLNLCRRRKILITLNMLFGSFAICISIFRLIDLINHRRASTSRRLMRCVTLTSIECQVAAVASSLIPLRPLLNRLIHWYRCKACRLARSRSFHRRASVPSPQTSPTATASTSASLHGVGYYCTASTAFNGGGGVGVGLLNASSLQPSQRLVADWKIRQFSWSKPATWLPLILPAHSSSQHRKSRRHHLRRASWNSTTSSGSPPSEASSSIDANLTVPRNVEEAAGTPGMMMPEPAAVMGVRVADAAALEGRRRGSRTVIVEGREVDLSRGEIGVMGRCDVEGWEAMQDSPESSESEYSCSQRDPEKASLATEKQREVDLGVLEEQEEEEEEEVSDLDNEGGLSARPREHYGRLTPTGTREEAWEEIDLSEKTEEEEGRRVGAGLGGREDNAETASVTTVTAVGRDTIGRRGSSASTLATPAMVETRMGQIGLVRGETLGRGRGGRDEREGGRGGGAEGRGRPGVVG